MPDRSQQKPKTTKNTTNNTTQQNKKPQQPTNLLFVFGSRVDEALRAETACRLWRDGYFKHAIVSGGITPGGDESECTVIKQMMVAGGIPADIILEEHRATNTGENVVFSLPVIDAVLGLANIDSVICLGNTWTARRYPMTLQRHWPDVEKLLVTVDGFATPRARWHTDPEFCRRVLKEWDKIEPYKAKGFIADWP